MNRIVEIIAFVVVILFILEKIYNRFVKKEKIKELQYYRDKKS